MVSISDSFIFGAPPECEGSCTRVIRGEIFYEIAVEGLGSESFQNDIGIGDFCGDSIRFGECPSIPDIKCEEGTVPTRIEISHLGSLEGLNWIVGDTCSSDDDVYLSIVFEGERYPSSLLGALAISPMEVIEQTCLPVGACYEFRGFFPGDIYSEVEYSLFYNGVEVDFFQKYGCETFASLVDDCDCIAE
jgi:hypothetical protein